MCTRKRYTRDGACSCQWRMVSARRGVGTYVLNIEGKASHSGIAPEAGISAIQELSYKIQMLHSAHDKGLSVNVG